METIKSHNIKPSNGYSSPPSGELEGADYKNYLTAKGYTTETTQGMISTTNKFLMWINEQGIEITTINYNDITAFIKLNQSRGIKARIASFKQKLYKMYENSYMSSFYPKQVLF